MPNVRRGVLRDAEVGGPGDMNGKAIAAVLPDPEDRHLSTARFAKSIQT